VVLEVVGDPLPGDDEVALAELVGQGFPDATFTVVRQSWIVGQSDSH